MAVAPHVGAELASELIESRQLETLHTSCAGVRQRHSYVRGLFRLVNGGGHVGAALVCGRCGAGVRLVSLDTLRRARISVSSLPLLSDNRTVRCERCDEIGAELHHWAPQVLFPDADAWPMAFLCVACHRLWHQTMRTA